MTPFLDTFRTDGARKVRPIKEGCDVSGATLSSKFVPAEFYVLFLFLRWVRFAPTSSRVMEVWQLTNRLTYIWRTPRTRLIYFLFLGENMISIPDLFLSHWGDQSDKQSKGCRFESRDQG